MSDDGAGTDDGVVVDLPARGRRPPLTSENAAAMARRKAEVERERRAESQLQRQKRAAAVLGDAAEEALEAAESPAMANLSLQELGERVVRRQLKVMLFGGEAFMPTSPRECMELANMASMVALREVQKVRLSAGGDDGPEIESDAKSIAAGLKSLRKKLEQQRAVGS